MTPQQKALQDAIQKAWPNGEPNWLPTDDEGMALFKLECEAITQAKQALDQFGDANKMVQPTVHEVEYQRVRGEAQQLAVSLWIKHYRDDAPQWTVLDDALGALSQISNMVAGMVRPQASEPAGWKLVPVEATPQILALLNPHLNLTPVSRYAAMLAAAPEAK
jgi:nucleoid-associated protein YgaU